MLGLPIGLGRGTRLRKGNLPLSNLISEGLEVHYKPEERGSIIGTAPDVTALNDLSGNGHHAIVTGAATQLTHAAKGKAVLRCPYSSANVIDTGISTLTGSYLHASTGNTWDVLAIGSDASAYAGYIISQGNFSNRQFVIGWKPENGGTVFIRINNSADTVLATNVGGGIWAVRAGWDGTALTVGIMLESDTEFTEVVVTPGLGSELTSNNIYLGTRDSGPANVFQGSICEVALYDQKLTTAQIEQMERYIAQNWTNKSYDARVIGVGDSITNGMFNAHSGNSLQTKFAIEASVYVDLYNEGVNGWRSVDLKDNIDSILSGYSSTSYPTYVIGHIGTNNCSITRPYHNPRNTFSTDIIAFPDHLDYIKAAVENAGYIFWLGQIPYYDRPFPEPGDGSTGVYLGKNMQYMNAKPYNDNIVEPWITANLPDFCHEDGTPYLQWYDYSYLNETTIDAGGGGGIHPGLSGYLSHGDYYAEVVGSYIKSGLAPVKLTRAAEDDLSGTKFVICMGSSTDPGGTNIMWPGALTFTGGTLEQPPLVSYSEGGNSSPFKLTYSAFDQHNGSTFTTSGDTSNSLTNSTLQDVDMRVFGDGNSIDLLLEYMPPNVNIRVGLVGSQTTGSFGEAVNNTVTVQDGELFQATTQHNIRAVPATPVYLETLTKTNGDVTIKTQDNSTRNITSICGVSCEIL